MKCYIAASFPRKGEAIELANVMKSRGHIINARWLYHSDVYGLDLPEQERFRIASEDFEDIDRSDEVIILTGDNLSLGGRHTELGYAIRARCLVYVIGPRDNVFMYHPQVTQFSTMSEFLRFVVDGYAMLEG